jgi:hypothetical protein
VSSRLCLFLPLLLAFALSLAETELALEMPFSPS